MPEHVLSWWERRRFSKGAAVPYARGTYREAWRPYPVLVRQFHPELNHGIVLSQIPPAADVLLQWECEAGHRFAATPSEQRDRPGRTRRRSVWCPDCRELAGGRERARPRPARLCRRSQAELHPVGAAFTSGCAPATASAAEGELRALLEARLEFTPGLDAVRVARPFFDHLEVWPDIVLDEFRVAIEFDTVGRHGLEHVGRREDVDRRKDRALRAAGWEVVRVRTRPLLPLGPFDLEAGGVSRRLADRLVERIAEIRGELLVAAWRRRSAG